MAYLPANKSKVMICRIWHGFTSKEKAMEYENMLRQEILPGIHRVSGYKGAQLLRRNHPEEVEFITMTYFEDLNAIIEFAGKDDYSRAVIHPKGKILLKRYDSHSAHYDLVDLVMPDFKH